MADNYRKREIGFWQYNCISCSIWFLRTKSIYCYCKDSIFMYWRKKHTYQVFYFHDIMIHDKTIWMYHVIFSKQNLNDFLGSYFTTRCIYVDIDILIYRYSGNILIIFMPIKISYTLLISNQNLGESIEREREREQWIGWKNCHTIIENLK